MMHESGRHWGWGWLRFSIQMQMDGNQPTDHPEHGGRSKMPISIKHGTAQSGSATLGWEQVRAVFMAVWGYFKHLGILRQVHWHRWWRWLRQKNGYTLTGGFSTNSFIRKFRKWFATCPGPKFRTSWYLQGIEVFGGDGRVAAQESTATAPCSDHSPHTEPLYWSGPTYVLLPAEIQSGLSTPSFRQMGGYDTQKVKLRYFAGWEAKTWKHHSLESYCKVCNKCLEALESWWRASRQKIATNMADDVVPKWEHSHMEMKEERWQSTQTLELNAQAQKLLVCPSPWSALQRLCGQS